MRKSNFLHIILLLIICISTVECANKNFSIKNESQINSEVKTITDLKVKNSDYKLVWAEEFNGKGVPDRKSVV